MSLEDFGCFWKNFYGYSVRVPFREQIIYLKNTHNLLFSCTVTELNKYVYESAYCMYWGDSTYHFLFIVVDLDVLPVHSLHTYIRSMSVLPSHICCADDH